MLRCIGQAILVCLATLVGCSVGTLVADYMGSPEAVRWRSLGAPPEQAVKILGVGIDFVYIESATGKTFYYDTGDSPQKRGWEEVSRSLVQTRSSPSQFWGTPVPNPPGKVIDRALAEFLDPELTRQAIYVVSGDGTVLMWKYSTAGVQVVEGVLPGGVIGFLAGILFITLISREPS